MYFLKLKRKKMYKKNGESEPEISWNHAIAQIVVNIVQSELVFYCAFSFCTFFLISLFWSWFIYYVYPEVLVNPSVSQLFLMFDIFVSYVTTQFIAPHSKGYSGPAYEFRSFVLNIKDWMNFIDMQPQTSDDQKQSLRNRLSGLTDDTYELYMTVGESETQKHRRRGVLTTIEKKCTEVMYTQMNQGISNSYLTEAKTVFRDFDLRSNVRNIDGYHVFFTIALLAYLFIGMPIKNAFSAPMITAALLTGTVGLFFSFFSLIDLYLKNPFDQNRPFHVASHAQWVEEIHERAKRKLVFDSTERATGSTEKAIDSTEKATAILNPSIVPIANSLTYRQFANRYHGLEF